MIRLSLAPGAAMLLSGFKAFTDIERSSNIMVWTQQAFVIESDPTLRMFKFFGKLIGSQTRCFVTTTRQPEVGMEVERVATDQQCTLILVPWHTDGKEEYAFCLNKI